MIAELMSSRSHLACTIALDAVSTVVFEENGHKEIDIKQYAKVEKACGCVAHVAVSHVRFRFLEARLRSQQCYAAS